jgi:hypothetical protein
MLLFNSPNESKGNCFESFNLNSFSPEILSVNKHSAYRANLQHDDMIGQNKNHILDANYNKQILSPVDLKFQNTYENYNACPIILKLDRSASLSVLPTSNLKFRLTYAYIQYIYIYIYIYLLFFLLILIYLVQNEFEEVIKKSNNEQNKMIDYCSNLTFKSNENNNTMIDMHANLCFSNCDDQIKAKHSIANINNSDAKEMATTNLLFGSNSNYNKYEKIFDTEFEDMNNFLKENDKTVKVHIENCQNQNRVNIQISQSEREYNIKSEFDFIDSEKNLINDGSGCLVNLSNTLPPIGYASQTCEMVKPIEENDENILFNIDSSLDYNFEQYEYFNYEMHDNKVDSKNASFNCGRPTLSNELYINKAIYKFPDNNCNRSNELEHFNFVEFKRDLCNEVKTSQKMQQNYNGDISNQNDALESSVHTSDLIMNQTINDRQVNGGNQCLSDINLEKNKIDLTVEGHKIKQPGWWETKPAEECDSNNFVSFELFS